MQIEPVRIHLCYAGRVQGVGFRVTTRDIAGRYAVSGWVRNESDGSVAAELQGDRDEVERCLADIAQTMAGNIESVERHSVSALTRESGFMIRYS